MFWSFALVYAFCEMGENVTNQFNEFEKELGQSDWYIFSMKLQRIYIIVLANAEQPKTVHGFGNIMCLREYMKKVFHNFKNNDKRILFMRIEEWQSSQVSTHSD